jgi:outer membrane immunogenic protein
MRRIMLGAVMASLASTTVAADDATRWTGLYVGASAGYAWSGDGRVDLAIQNGPQVPGVGTLDLSGPFAAVQAGVNWQHGRLVLGLEADLAAGHLDASFGPVAANAPGVLIVSGKTDIHHLATVRGRVGFTHDRFLFFLTGGWAGADVRHRLTALDPGDPFSEGEDPDVTFTFLSHGRRHGYALGGGLEWEMRERWSLKLEYLWIDLGRHTLTADGVGAFVPVTAQSSDRLELHTIRLGINLRFEGL